MARWWTVVAGAVMVVAGVAPEASAWGDLPKSNLQVIAENPKARFDPKVQMLLIEQRLQRPVDFDPYPPYMRTYGDAGLDDQIRRLGALIRREQAERIDRAPVDQDFVVQVGRGAASRVAREPDELAALNALAARDGDLLQVAVAALGGGARSLGPLRNAEADRGHARGMVRRGSGGWRAGRLRRPRRPGASGPRVVPA
jgi:hypothetical protein